jgi:uncharacterized protein (DUF342 family)
MAEIKWCKDEDVEKRLKSIQTAKNHNSNDVKESIEQAVNKMKPVLVAKYGSSKVAEWTSETNVPLSLREMTADFASAFILQNCYAQSVTDYLSKAGSLYKIASDLLNAIASGKAEIVDMAGDKVIDAMDSIEDSTEGKTKQYTMNHPDDTDFGEGSLDDL